MRSPLSLDSLLSLGLPWAEQNERLGVLPLFLDVVNCANKGKHADLVVPDAFSVFLGFHGGREIAWSMMDLSY